MENNDDNNNNNKKNTSVGLAFREHRRVKQQNKLEFSLVTVNVVICSHQKWAFPVDSLLYDPSFNRDFTLYDLSFNRDYLNDPSFNRDFTLYDPNFNSDFTA